MLWTRLIKLVKWQSAFIVFGSLTTFIGRKMALCTISDLFFKHNPSKCHLCDWSLNNHIPILGSNYTGNPLIQLMTPSRFLSSLCNLPCIDAFYKGYDSRHNGWKKIQSRIRIFIKFRYSKKATKIWKKVSQFIGKFKRVTRF